MELILIVNAIVMTILAVISYEDLKLRKIYNKRLLFLIPFLILMKFLEPADWTEWYLVAKSTIIISFVFLALGFFGLVGMGDVKLLMVLLPTIPSDEIKNFLISFLFLGGVLAILQLLFLNKLFAYWKLSTKGVPYGIPIIVSYLWFSGIIH